MKLNLLLAALVSIASAEFSFRRSERETVVTSEGELFQLPCAMATYRDRVNETGWGELSVLGKSSCGLIDATYDMGYLEGYLTWTRISQAFDNFNRSNSWLQNGNLPPQIAAFVDTQLNWLSEMSSSEPSLYWQHVGGLMSQERGLIAGFHNASNNALSGMQVYILSLAGDLEDLSRMFGFSSKKSSHSDSSHMDCSALVKLTPNFDKLFVGHTTFNAYW